ncbi:50S ribosomal protein L16 [Candidatus Woesearchaeota archaeon]|nr:50S ribosomal protein L16 [Candidatus Woesearchaeota archaeon]
MAKLRRWRAYRNIERPFTRVSKFKKKSYIRMTPVRKVVRYDMGEEGKYGYVIDLIPKKTLQIRQEAIESARQTSIRWLEKNIVKGAGFHFKIRKYPYHILRENPLAAGAGADRMSTGMQKSYGKPIGTAIQIQKGDRLFSVEVNKQFVDVARKAFSRASQKLPCSFTIRATEKKS